MRSLDLIGFGRHDPCARWIDGAFWLAARTPDGPGTICFYAEISGKATATGGLAVGGLAAGGFGAEGAGGARREIVGPPDVENGPLATCGGPTIIVPGRAAGGESAAGAGWEGGGGSAGRGGSAGDGGEHGEGGRGGEWADGRGTDNGQQMVWVADGVLATAYGPGGAWLAKQAGSMLGLNDDVAGFDPSRHPLVKRLAHENQGLRFPGTRLIFPRLLRSICEQKVTGKEAYRAYTAIVRYFREKAPGPRDDLFLPPDPQRIARTPYYEFHPLGLERKRADTLRRAAFEMPRLERCESSAELSRRLVSIPGIGVWTAAEVVRIVFGDPDAVSVGDYHMKNIVSWALAGEPRGTDERMLELLEPFRGHRGRVCLLLEAAGIGAPRYGHRMPIREFHTW